MLTREGKGPVRPSVTGRPVCYVKARGDQSYDDIPCFFWWKKPTSHTQYDQCLDNCWAPEGFGVVQTGPRVCCWQRRPKWERWSVTVNTAPGSVQEERRSRESRRTPLQLCVVGSHCDRHLYELSRASRTFMICCLMTLVASPALGIKYLRGEEAFTDH